MNVTKMASVLISLAAMIVRVTRVTVVMAKIVPCQMHVNRTHVTRMQHVQQLSTRLHMKPLTSVLAVPDGKETVTTAWILTMLIRGYLRRSCDL